MKSLIAVGLVALLLGFGSGVFIGRELPAHHFQRFGESRFLLDSATGKVCDPLPRPKANPIDEALKPPPGYVLEGNKDANGFPLVSSVYPACAD